MQPSPNPQTWAGVFTYLSGILTVVIPLLVKSWLDRKKSSIESADVVARTEFTRASAQSIALRDSLATGEGVGKILGDLIEAGDTIGEMQKRMFKLEQDNIELAMARMDIKILKGLLDAHGISYAEKDKPRTRS